MSRSMTVVRERIKILFSEVNFIRSWFKGCVKGDMVVGTTRETDTTRISEDMMFVRILLNSRLSVPMLAKKTLLPRT